MCGFVLFFKVCTVLSSKKESKDCTVFIFVQNQCKKRFWAKLGIELTTTRGSTDRCFDHSATELVVNLQGSLESYTNPKIRSHSSGSHGPLNEFEQVPLLQKVSPKVNGGSQTSGMPNFCELLLFRTFQASQGRKFGRKSVIGMIWKGIFVFAHWIPSPQIVLQKGL